MKKNSVLYKYFITYTAIILAMCYIRFPALIPHNTPNKRIKSYTRVTYLQLYICYTVDFLTLFVAFWQKNKFIYMLLPYVYKQSMFSISLHFVRLIPNSIPVVPRPSKTYIYNRKIVCPEMSYQTVYHILFLVIFATRHTYI